MGSSGKIENKKYLSQVAKEIASRKCPRCDTKKLIYRGEEMTFQEFVSQLEAGIIEPRGRLPKKFVCSCI